jgi:glycosyltransferase involved in cell wall biosynthesis
MTYSKNRINLHIYPGDITYQSRIQKEIDSLIKLKLIDEIVIICQNPGSKPSVEKLNTKITIHYIKLFRHYTSNNILRRLLVIEFFIKAIIKSLYLEFDIINCHTIHVLPIGVFVKIIKRKKVIYDTHELETEVDGSKGLLKFFSKILEKVCIKFVDHTFVVNNSIKEWYFNKYHLNHISTIRNIPLHINVPNERSKILNYHFNIPDHHQIFIYQGMLSKKRGMDVILNTFKLINSKEKHIVFLGHGSLKEEILLSSEKFSNIHFMSTVSLQELPKFTSGADVGIHMILNTCLNHYYCLPNKVFEYFKYGIPMIASNFPEMSNLIKENKIGWCISPDTESLLNLVESISKSDINYYRMNTHQNKDSYSWENEEKEYVIAYNRLNN